MKVAFSIFGKKNDLCIMYDTSWDLGHIQGKIKQWERSRKKWERNEIDKDMRKTDFSQRNQNPITWI